MSAPAWYLDALREMKETRRGGVVCVIPQDGLLSGISRNLKSLVEDDSRTLRALRRRAVLVLIPQTLARECLPDVEDGKTLVILDADARVLKAEEADLAETLMPGVFAKRIGKLLGKKDVGSDAPARALPYGVEWAEGSDRDLFGTPYDTCPGCGMPSMDENAARMIKYLRLLA
ncbi:MAG TPA: hypothetical protein VF950_19535 [Planctomycetota bacterium]